MGEEDSSELRSNEELCNLALALCNAHGGGARSREEFLESVDKGLEEDRGQERTWVTWSRQGMTYSSSMSCHRNHRRMASY